MNDTRVVRERALDVAEQTKRLHDCKGVRCPPIFSLSNLINVGWL